ncbi:hypothetical protein [Consotaella salsifontis]|uniref:Uncharacterized protein n=1 Tax=Consotaella salsifontis TaxID=1365950 RepID=A0A1T4SRV5_9HYPH|nr:hypothetical protein [Consotaella salsifontis]SKA30893.1 hypothetical protein SAMN05428963_11382 [Consotaella salsifontis]
MKFFNVWKIRNRWVRAVVTVTIVTPILIAIMSPLLIIHALLGAVERLDSDVSIIWDEAGDGYIKAITGKDSAA